MFFRVPADENDKCPFCKEKVTEWQSKDSIDFHDTHGECCELHPENTIFSGCITLQKYEVYNFYTICKNKECGEWIEYKLKHKYNGD